MLSSLKGSLRAGASALCRKLVQVGTSVRGGTVRGVLIEDGAQARSQLATYATRTPTASWKGWTLDPGLFSRNVNVPARMTDSMKRASSFAAPFCGEQQKAVKSISYLAAQHSHQVGRQLVCGNPTILGGFPRVTQSSLLVQQTRGVKTKIKPYSSWKRRFQLTAKGNFVRKQKGKRHKAFSKTPKQRMQLRGTKLVHKTLVQPMRKLGFKLT